MSPALPGRGQANWDTPLNAWLLSARNSDGTLANHKPVFNVKDDYSAAGDGSTDDTTAIQNAITAAGAVNGIVYIPEGRYRISSDLVCVGGETIEGSGAGSIIEPTDDSTDDVERGFLIKNTSNVTIRNLKYDGNADSLTQAVPHSAVFISGASRNTVDGLVTTNLGHADSNGGGSHIVIRAWETNSSFALADDHTGVDCNYNTVKNCLLNDPAGRASFGIRIKTEWKEAQTNGAYNVVAEYNSFVNNTLVGFTQNAMEIAGPMTRYNTIIGNRSKNHMGDTAIEADKGACYNTFMGNIVADVMTNAGVDTTWAYRCQGYVNSTNVAYNRVAEHNAFVGNVVAKMPGVTATSAGFGFSEAQYNVLVGNSFDVSNGASPADTYGIFVGPSCHHLVIADNLVEHSGDGVRSEVANIDTNCTGITVSGNQLYVARNGIWFSSSGSEKWSDVVVRDNVISGSDNVGVHLGTGTVDCAAIGNVVREPGDVEIPGIRINGTNCLVTQNVVRGIDSSGTNVMLQSGATGTVLGSNYEFEV